MQGGGSMMQFGQPQSAPDRGVTMQGHQHGHSPTYGEAMQGNQHDQVQPAFGALLSWLDMTQDRHAMVYETYAWKLKDALQDDSKVTTTGGTFHPTLSNFELYNETNLVDDKKGGDEVQVYSKTLKTFWSKLLSEANLKHADFGKNSHETNKPHIGNILVAFSRLHQNGWPTSASTPDGTNSQALQNHTAPPSVTGLTASGTAVRSDGPPAASIPTVIPGDASTPVEVPSGGRSGEAARASGHNIAETRKPSVGNSCESPNKLSDREILGKAHLLARAFTVKEMLEIGKYSDAICKQKKDNKRKDDKRKDDEWEDDERTDDLLGSFENYNEAMLVIGNYGKLPRVPYENLQELWKQVEKTMLHVDVNALVSDEDQEYIIASDLVLGSKKNTKKNIGRILVKFARIHSAYMSEDWAFDCKEHLEPHDIFISYRKISDKKLAKTLKDLLQVKGKDGEKGFNVFLDDDCLTPGRPNSEQFMKNLRGSTMVILLMSEGAVQRFSCSSSANAPAAAPDYMLNEWTEALRGLEHGLPTSRIRSVVPIMLDGFEGFSLDLYREDVRDLMRSIFKRQVIKGALSTEPEMVVEEILKIIPSDDTRVKTASTIPSTAGAGLGVAASTMHPAMTTFASNGNTMTTSLMPGAISVRVDLSGYDPSSVPGFTIQVDGAVPGRGKKSSLREIKADEKVKVDALPAVDDIEAAPQRRVAKPARKIRDGCCTIL
ncbi:hypothetical protein HK101_003281 [Irineochytrium annulatum]|nr:hypothetical protein HK101_003281 [Irineochytrium annulatum]